ncbi:MAG: hypothetical protein NVS3B21_04590 [Acidimicrobiales bacterium]
MTGQANGPIVAIDGPAGSGKSTVARAVAKRLDVHYLDTGAMYRAVAFAALHRGIDPEDREPVAHLAREMVLDVGETVVVDGIDATIEIRGPEVTRAVSVVASNEEVRNELRDRQRAWVSAHGGGVVEGRDIGTVVFPEADLKVYLTADDAERARRRHKEVTDLHYDAHSPGLEVETVQAELARRDHLDSTRAASPLAQADDAVVIDTTDRPVEEIVDAILGHLGTRAEAAAESELTASEVPAPRNAAPLTIPESRPRNEPARSQPGRLGELADRLLYRVIRSMILGFSLAFWRLRIEGASNLPASGPYVVAPVHRSNVDTPLIALISKRRLRFMGKDSMWRSPLAGRLFTALGGFPVHRGTVDRDALRRCVEVIAGGEPLVIFPEGTRQSGPIVGELFEGAAYVATRTGVPIVPVGIGGSERAMPKGAKGLRPVAVRIVIGAPIEPPPTGDGARRASRRAVKELTACLQTEIQAAFDLAEHRSPR